MGRPHEHAPRSAALSADEAEQLAEFMAAFSAPSRLRVLFALAGMERSVEELSEATGLLPNAISQQLRVLRLLQMVQGRRDGRHMRYRLFDEHVADLLTVIRHHGEHASDAVAHDRAATRKAR